MNPAATLVVWMIRGYQRLISRYTPPVCRFHPTCSSYAVCAVSRHGLLKGGGLAAWRIFRCNPFFEGGVDPVPPVAAAGASPPPGAIDE